MTLADWFMLASWVVWSVHYCRTETRIAKLRKENAIYPTAFDITAAELINEFNRTEPFVGRSAGLSVSKPILIHGERFVMKLEREN